MKVAFLSVLPPPGQPAVSGVHRVSQTLLRQFESLPDLEVEAITLIDGLPKETVIKSGNVRYHYLPCKRVGKTVTLYLGERMRLKRRVRMVGPEIVHGQPTAEFLLAATGAGLPNVITIHGLVAKEFATLARWRPGRVAGTIREMLHQQAIKQAQHIISISSYVEEYVAGITDCACSPIPNPIEPEFFRIEPPTCAGLRILCVGIVSERKNQLWLVEACAELAAAGIPFECRIVGRYSPGYEAVIGPRVQSSKVKDRINLVGPVGERELLAHYAWSNVIVLPSREETSPLSLIQGMACGRPVFGADAAGIPRLLEGGSYGTLFPLDHPGSLAQRLEAFARNGDPWWKMAERSLAFALENFEPGAVAARTAGLYRSILATRRSPQPGNHRH